MGCNPPLFSMTEVSVAHCCPQTNGPLHSMTHVFCSQQKDNVSLYNLTIGYHHVATCTCTAVTMAKIQFLTILLTVTCFLGSVVSVTDKEFDVSTVRN